MIEVTTYQWSHRTENLRWSREHERRIWDEAERNEMKKKEKKKKQPRIENTLDVARMSRWEGKKKFWEACHMCQAESLREAWDCESV